MDRGKNFLELFPNESQNSPLLFCAYRKMGLLCWSAAQPNQLRFIAAFATNPAISTSSTQLDQNALFKLITTISLSPELPHGVEFTQLLVNSAGSWLALVGRRMVFLVAMDPDFWDRQRVGGLDFHFAVDHLRPNYIAKCDLIHMTLFMRKCPPSVLKAIWFEPQEDGRHFFHRAGLMVPNGMLGLLYSDNVVRLYDANMALDRPCSQLDFNILLPDRTPNESGDEFGGDVSSSHSEMESRAYSNLVSFDFGPLKLLNYSNTSASSPSTSSFQQEEATLFGSLLTMDSNGELYIGHFPFRQESAPTNMQTTAGPLQCRFPTMQPSIQAQLLCSAQDLHCCRHSHSQMVSTWALTSEDGLLLHLILTSQGSSSTGADEANKRKESNTYSFGKFELFTVECLQIAAAGTAAGRHLGTEARMRGSTRTVSNKAAKVLRLQDDWTNTPSYIAVCANDLYRLELVPLLTSLVAKLTATNAANISLPQSVVHHLLVFADVKESHQIQSTISSIAFLGLPNNAPEEEERDIRGPQNEDQHLLMLALCTANTVKPKSSQSQSVKHCKHTFSASLLKKHSSNSTGTSQMDLLLSPPSMQRQKQQNQKASQSHITPSISEEVRRQLGTQNNAGIPTVIILDQVEGGEAGTLDDRQKMAQRIENVSLVQNAIQDLLQPRNLPARDEAIEIALQRANALLTELQSVAQFRESTQQRLTSNFHQITELKTQILRRQRQYQALEERIKKISYTLQPLMFQGSEQENEAIENLRNMQQRLIESLREIKKHNQRINEHRQQFFAGQPAFQSSSSTIASGSDTKGPVPAQLYILSKNGRECNKLREKVHLLQRQFD